jgi:hypothetical protein
MRALLPCIGIFEDSWDTGDSPKVCIGKSFHPNFMTSSLFFRNCCGAHGEGEAGRKPVFLCVLVYVVYLTGRALDMVSLIV